MQTDYVDHQVFMRLLDALMPENRDAMMIALMTGLRINDVLGLKKQDIPSWQPGETFTITEQKTGKERTVKLTANLVTILDRNGWHFSEYFFPHRLDLGKHRTRQAVWKDLKHVARMYRLDGKKLRENIGPHSARKTYAVELFRCTGDIDQVQDVLNHSDPAVTCLYAMADIITKQRLKEVADINRALATRLKSKREPDGPVAVAERTGAGYAASAFQSPPTARSLCDLTEVGK